MIENVDYRQISKNITKLGTPMTFTGVRAVFLKAMQKIALEYIKEYADSDYPSQKNMSHELANSQYFHDTLCEHLYKIYSIERF